MKRKLAIATLAVVAVFGLAACNNPHNSALTHNQAVEQTQENIYNQNQPVPVFNKSQLRQTMIEVETAQSQPTPTTTFFFNQGSVDPLTSCPSIGFPVPTTDQISNPQQLARTGGNYSLSGSLPQIDPNGVYSGDSTGTYVLCLNEAGTPYVAYWEGFVYAVSGAASWDFAKHQMSSLTNPTGNFTALSPGQVHAVGSTTPTTTKK